VGAAPAGQTVRAMAAWPGYGAQLAPRELQARLNELLQLRGPNAMPYAEEHKLIVRDHLLQLQEARPRARAAHRARARRATGPRKQRSRFPRAVPRRARAAVTARLRRAGVPRSWPGSAPAPPPPLPAHGGPACGGALRKPQPGQQVPAINSRPVQQRAWRPRRLRACACTDLLP